MRNSGRRKIFTWHIHGSYLYYLSQADIDLYIPVNDKHDEGYYGRGETFPFGPNVIEVEAEKVRELELDCILFQTNKNYLVDQFEVLSETQRRLPRIYLEHDPPRQHPTDTSHIMKDPDVLLVHVTHFNRLMWDNGQVQTKVIEHGVTPPEATYSGHIPRGLVVINNLPSRGRLLGLDIFLEVRKHIPIDLIGMGTGELGLGEVLHPQLPAFNSQYRFFFNPIRYTSFGLAVCEAMMLGMPVVGLATTEMSSVFTNGKTGYVHTNIEWLIERMRELINEPDLARAIGKGGQQLAKERFGIGRFTREWEETFESVINRKSVKASLSPNYSS